MTADIDSELQFLLDQIRDEMRATSYLTGCPTLEQRVVLALQQVPRHAFVPDELQHSAYANRPLPIGHGQTVSQPYIVALMTELVRPAPMTWCWKSAPVRAIRPPSWPIW